MLFALFTIFTYPLLSCWSLSYDETVQYWIGTYMFWWTVGIPIWFFIHYFIQMTLTRPKRALVVASFIIPCVVFFLVGGSVRFRAQAVMDRISGSDCDVYEDTRELVKSHERAVEKYKECHPAGGRSGFDMLFQSCPKYKAWRKEDGNARHWDYLMYLETNFACTGFCQPAEESLWSHKEYHDRLNWDACFNVVYSVMLSKVARAGLLLMCYPVFVIIGFLCWHLTVRPTFQKMSEGQHGHFRDDFFKKAEEAADFAKHAAQNAYGAVEQGIERVKMNADQYSPRQRVPPPPQEPVFIPSSQPMMANSMVIGPPPPPQPAFIPSGQPMMANSMVVGQTLIPPPAAWSAPPAPGYANPQMPARM
jgi:hypothetical protein